VCKSVQVPMEHWRVILLRRNASELLGFHSASGLKLPRVDIPAHGRAAQALNAQIKARWGLDVYCLYPLPTAEFSGATARYYLTEALQQEPPAPPEARWISVGDLEESCFAETRDFAAIRTWIDSAARGNTNDHDSPLEKPGWFPTLRDLVQESIQAIPLTLSGQFLQFNASSSFSLIRFETDGDAVWFKAVGEPNTREYPLTVALSSRLPTYLPRVLATQPLWNAWMMLEVPGVRLSQTDDLSAWSNAARDLARMQVASVEMVEDILECQARDTRLETLLRQIRPFFKQLHGLMERQPKSPPPRLSSSELVQLELDTREVLLALQKEGLPDSLGHLDLNPENIIALPDRTVFLDWAEGSVGHPFFSFAYLLEHFLRTFGANAPGQSCLIRAYADVWESTPSVTNPEKALSASTFLAVFAHAVSTGLWRDERKLLEPAVAGYYRSLARHMKRHRDRMRSGISRIAEYLPREEKTPCFS
jgi:hypothetical protein